MALTSNQMIKHLQGEEIASYPVKANTHIYKGAYVSIEDGYAKNLEDGEKFAGVAKFEADNTAPNTDAAAGSISVTAYRKVRMEVALDNVNKYMIGAYVYAYDESVLSLAPLSTPVGKVVQVDGCATDYAIVEFNADLNRRIMGGVCGMFEPFFTLPSQGGVAANNTGVMNAIIRTSVNGPGIIDSIRTQGYPYHGGLSIVPDTADNDSESLQYMGFPIKYSAATRPIFFGTKFTARDAAIDQDFIIGLNSVDTALLAGSDDGITWRVVEGSADLKLYVEHTTTETASAAAEGTLVINTAVNLGFVYDGTYVYPYVNGVAGTGLAITNLPTLDLLPSIEFTAGGATSLGCIISFLDAYQII